MPAAVLVRGGATLRLDRARGDAASFALAPTADVVAWLAGPPGGEAPDAVLRWIRELAGAEELRVEDERLRQATRTAGRSGRLATWAELRAPREHAVPAEFPSSRALQLAIGRRALELAIADPEQLLISLAREEERLERALGRETAAVDQLLVAPGPGAGTEYLRDARSYHDALVRHHATLRTRLAALAREVVPNLTAVVGTPVAPRLVSAAGGARALARMSGARIQLLGARRRPSPVRGPRYGHLFRAPHLDELPRTRGAAYARSLAALAAIAVRADVYTRRDIAAGLLARRERRIRQLQRGR